MRDFETSRPRIAPSLGMLAEAKSRDARSTYCVSANEIAAGSAFFRPVLLCQDLQAQGRGDSQAVALASTSRSVLKFAHVTATINRIDVGLL
jgi:hypothetical protein